MFPLKEKPPKFDKEFFCFCGNIALSVFLWNTNIRFFCNVNYEENVIGLFFKKTKGALQRK